MVDAVQLRDAEQKGIQIGTEQGIQIGTEQGIQQGHRHLLLKLMTRRLGEVPSSIAVMLETLSADILEDLGVSLPDFHAYADVERWLARLTED